MINIPEEVKQACNDISVTFREIIIVDGQEVVTKVKFSDDSYSNGNYIGTFIMKTIEFEAENNIEYKEKEVVYYREINGTRFKVGTFIVQDIKDNDTNETVKVTAYDYGLKFANTYVTDLDYKNTKVTMRDVIEEVCTKVGVVFANSTFANENFIVDSNQFTENSQYGNVVKAVAQMSGSIAKINENDELELIFNEDYENAEIIEDYTELEDKRDTRLITVVELGMSQVTGQNITMRWTEGIAIYGENKLVINDNPFAYTQAKRTELITAIFEQVKGFGYSSFTSKKVFKPYLQVGDLVKLKNKQGELINSIVLRINTNHQEIELSAPSVIDATVEYEQPATAEDMANRAEIIVNQQEKTIQALVTSNTELVNKTTKLELDVDTIKGQISEVADVTVTADGYGTINVENINQSEPIMIRIYPTNEDITPLRPKAGLYPRKGLYPHKREIVFTRTSNEEEPYTLEYNIPADLYKLDNYYDEFILDYENQRCYINRNIAIDENGEKYLLEIPTVEEYEYPTLQLLEGNYKIYMPAFQNAYIYVRLMTSNIYTSQFATKVELNSKIEQTVNSIDLNINKKLENYSTTEEMNSALTLTAGSILNSVSGTYATKNSLNEVNKTLTASLELKINIEDLISEINASADQIKLEAGRLIITSGNFLLDEYGNMTANNATFKGTIEAGTEIEGATITGSTFRSTNNDFYVSDTGQVTCKVLKIIGYSNSSVTFYVYSVQTGRRITFTSESIDFRNNTTDSPVLSLSNTGTSGHITCFGTIEAKGTTGSILCDGSVFAKDFVNNSEEKIKTNIKKLNLNENKILNKIIKSDICEFNYQDKKEKTIGLVIGENYNLPEEVIKIKKDEYGNETKGVDLYSMISLAWQAIKEMNVEINNLKNNK